MRVKVTLTTHQHLDGERETHVTTAQGRLTGRAGQWVLRYVEQDEEHQTRFTTLRISDGEVVMERPAPYPTRLPLRRGVHCTGTYGTPYGAMSMGVYTHAVHDRLSPEGGSLELRYALEVGGDPIETILLLDVEKIIEE